MRSGSCWEAHASKVIFWLVCALGVGSIDSPRAQNLDRPGLVHLGNAKWGTREEAKQAGLFEYQGRWLPTSMERQLAAWEKLDRNCKSWKDAWTTRSRNYQIKTTLPRWVVELEIKPFLDELHRTYTTVFADYFGLKGKASGQAVICIHGSYEEYREVTGRTRGSPGYIVDGTELRTFYEDFDPATFYNTTFHEGAHQFFDALLPGAELPTWLTEAIASYFEGCTWSRATRKVTVSWLPPDRLTIAKMQLARATSPSPDQLFMGVDRPQFTALHYALGWSFVYYLTHSGDGATRSDFIKFLRRMNGSGAKPAAAVYKEATGKPIEATYEGWRPFIMEAPEPTSPKWVLLQVGEVPIEVDLRSGDAVLSLDGDCITSTEQFNERWEALHAAGKPFDLAVVRWQPISDQPMDEAATVVRNRIFPTPRLPVYASALKSRSHGLRD